jgi:hypothetical protein
MNPRLNRRLLLALAPHGDGYATTFDVGLEPA